MNSVFKGFYATKTLKSKTVELTRKPTLPKRSCQLETAAPRESGAFVQMMVDCNNFTGHSHEGARTVPSVSYDAAT